MKKARRGFTLVEVGIFLAITGALFLAVTIGVQNSIYQQRFNDSVQGFVEFLRTVYGGVLDVQGLNDYKGRSNDVMYGKLVTFGGPVDKADVVEDAMYVYNIIGNDNPECGIDTNCGAIDLLNIANARISKSDVVEKYVPRWGASVESSCKETGSSLDCDESYEGFDGALLIARHPISGTVYTYVSDSNRNNVVGTDTESGKIIVGQFELKQVDFCVNPEPTNAKIKRQDVRIIRGATNSSGIEIVGTDNSDSKCNSN